MTKFSAICHISRQYAYILIDNLNCKQFTNSDCDAALVLATQPALAAVLAEAMAAEFATPAQKGAGAPPPSIPQANKDAVCTSPNGPTGCKSPTCPGKTSDNSSTKANAKAEKRRRQADNKSHGIAAMPKLEAGEDCRDFMHSQILGRIAFYQGNDREGYLHIKNNPDENHQAMLKGDNIPNTLAYGKYYKDTYQKFSGWSVINGDMCVFLGSDGDGVKIITAYISSTKAAVFKRRTAIENKEV